MPLFRSLAASASCPGKRKVSKRILSIMPLFRSLAASAFPRKKKCKQKKPEYCAAFIAFRYFRFLSRKKKGSPKNPDIMLLFTSLWFRSLSPAPIQSVCPFCARFGRPPDKKQNARLIQADRPVHCDKYSTFSDVCQRFFIGFSQKMPEKPPIRAKNFFLQAFFSRTYRCCAPSCAREASRRVSPRPRCGGTRPRLRGRSRPRRSTPYRSRPPRTRGRNS